MKLDISEIKNYWVNLPPSTKKKGFFIAIALVVVVVYLFMPDSAPKQQAATLSEGNTKSVFSPSDTRAVGMDGIAATLKEMGKRQQDTNNVIIELQKQLKDLNARRGETTDVQNQVGVMGRNIIQISESLRQQGFRVEDLETGKFNLTKPDSPDPRAGDIEQSSIPKPKKFEQPTPQYSDDNIFDRDDRNSNTNNNSEVRDSTGEKKSDSNLESKPSRLKITENKQVEVEKSEAEDIISAPSGTILSGVLITGVSAPAGPKASATPFPLDIRLQDLALLPNNNTMDLADCFVTSAVFGELSTERVQGRTEEISCITSAGVTMTGSIQGYLVGEDSKAGIRGTLVMRTGALIGNSLLAGFGQGLSKAMDRQAIPTINTSGSQQYSAFDSNSLQHGFSSGAGDALGNISKYYLDMANQIFPVIDVSGGRLVDIVLTGPLRLKPYNAKAIKEAKNEKK